MRPLKEITLYTEGLSEVDKEKLLSVLVLAETRLKSSWILQEQREGADVCLFRDCDQRAAEHRGAVICYGEASAESGMAAQEGLFILRTDSTHVPYFSDLINVFNQVDDWLSQPRQAETVTVAEFEQFEPQAEQEIMPEVGGETLSPESESPKAEDIPTLVPVIEEARAALPTSGSGPEELLESELEEGPEAALKLPWLGQITEYIQGLDPAVHYHKILLQSGEVILLDLDQKKFYSSIKIESFLDGNGDNKISYISSMDRQDFITEQNKQDYFERPLSNLKWFLALYSNVRGLDIDVDSQAYVLTEWPATDLPGLHRDHLKLAAFMRAKRASLAEISAETGIAVDLIQSFVEACYYEGLIQTDREPEEKKTSTPQKPKGFWGGVLRKIKW